MEPLKFELSPDAIWIPGYITHTFDIVFYDEGDLWRGLLWDGIIPAYERQPYSMKNGHLYVTVYDDERQPFCFQMKGLKKAYGIH
jgi:hypothetical protein